MKRLLLASVLAALPFAANAADLDSDSAQYNFIHDNAPAQPAVVGHLDLGVGYSSEEYNFGTRPDVKNGFFNGAGRANINFGGVNLEVETGGSARFKDGNSFSSIGVAGHLWGAMNNFAVGVYGGVNFPSAFGVFNGFTIYTVGGEAEAYLGAVTLGGDMEYNWTDGGGCCRPGDFWEARGWADLYLTPNARIGAEFRHRSWDDFFIAGSGAGFDSWTAVADAEYRLAGTPISGWIEGRYRRDELPDCVGCEIDTWAGMVGFRVFMDAPGTTLREHDRSVPWDSGLFDLQTTTVFAPIL